MKAFFRVVTSFIMKHKLWNILHGIYNSKAKLMNKSACKSFLDERQNSMFRMKPHYSTLKQLINKKNYRSSKSSPKRLTVILLVISFSFVALNLPYLIEW